MLATSGYCLNSTLLLGAHKSFYYKLHTTAPCLTFTHTLAHITWDLVSCPKILQHAD